MKLLELLVKERIEWPEGAENAVQDDDELISFYKSTPFRFGLTWDAEDKEVSDLHLDCCVQCDDWQTAIVTKEQYDNACKLVDDGYTLWFGGECPVNMNAHVEVVLCGDDLDGRDNFRRASDWRWEWEEGLTNIIAWRHYRKPENFDCPCQMTHSFDDPYKPVDVVNHPSHYTNGKVECIDAIESATVGKTGIEAVCVANVIKYLWRYEDKNGLEDIKKAQWYLNKLIEVKK